MTLSLFSKISNHRYLLTSRSALLPTAPYMILLKKVYFSIENLGLWARSEQDGSALDFVSKERTSNIQHPTSNVELWYAFGVSI